MLYVYCTFTHPVDTETENPSISKHVLQVPGSYIHQDFYPLVTSVSFIVSNLVICFFIFSYPVNDIVTEFRNISKKQKSQPKNIKKANQKSFKEI